jgi:biotin operon repressor
MNRITTWIACLLSLAMCAPASAADIDWSKVDQAMGKKGSDQPGGLRKYGLPRSDLKVTVDEVAIKPALALGSWLAFQPAGDGAMLMGDLVLTDTEISPVMQRLIEGGVEITAVHNHLLRTSVPVFYMHVGGHGDPVKLAEALHAGLALSKTPFTQAAASPTPAPLELDTAAIEKVLGSKGTVNSGVFQFSIPRAETVSEGGINVPPSMGTATALNFQPTGGGKAAITGDFVLLGSEVNPVLKTLREHGIEVTALHSHMVDDSPHLFFMHFWANDDAQRLAHVLRGALDLANLRRGS